MVNYLQVFPLELNTLDVVVVLLFCSGILLA